MLNVKYKQNVEKHKQKQKQKQQNKFRGEINMENKFIVSSSPHIRSNEDTSYIYPVFSM